MLAVFQTPQNISNKRRTRPGHFKGETSAPSVPQVYSDRYRLGPWIVDFWHIYNRKIHKILKKASVK